MGVSDLLCKGVGLIVELGASRKGRRNEMSSIQTGDVTDAELPVEGGEEAAAARRIGESATGSLGPI